MSEFGNNFKVSTNINYCYKTNVRLYLLDLNSNSSLARCCSVYSDASVKRIARFEQKS